MFICLDCFEVFEMPKTRLHDGEFEATSPCCGEDFIRAISCDYCQRYITDEYVELADKSRACVRCFTLKEVEA